MEHLTLRDALASDRLDVFVREQQDDGAELVTGSELERGLALLITQRRSLAADCRERHGSDWRRYRTGHGQVIGQRTSLRRLGNRGQFGVVNTPS